MWYILKVFPGGSRVKNLPAMQEICVRSLGQEDPLEKEMATHSSILASKSQSRRLQRVVHDLVTKQKQYFENFILESRTLKYSKTI